MFFLFELYLYCSLIFFSELLISLNLEKIKPLDSREYKSTLGPSVSLQESF